MYRQQFHQQVLACIRDIVRTDEMETRYTEFSNILIDATQQFNSAGRNHVSQSEVDDQ